MCQSLILILLSQQKMIDKTAYIESIIQKLKLQLVELEAELNSIDEEIGNETKSSAGDKFETSREMMSQARARVGERIEAIAMQLRSINQVEKQLNVVQHGALVKSNRGFFFFGLAIEKHHFEGNPVFNLSIHSPIGQAFANKTKGDEIDFRGNMYQLIDIA